MRGESSGAAAACSVTGNQGGCPPPPGCRTGSLGVTARELAGLKQFRRGHPESRSEGERISPVPVPTSPWCKDASSRLPSANLKPEEKEC